MLDVEIEPVSIDRFEPVVGADVHRRLAASMERAAECMRGHTVWSINSTAKGGGVAEMLSSLTGYLAGAGIRSRWLVVEGDDEFFALTKGIHNRLHGTDDGGGRLDGDARERYERSLEAEARDGLDRVERGDVVVVHDPQPAGLIPGLRDRGVTAVWRCHVGIDEPNDTARSAWEFLRPYVERADACVFSRRSYAWPGLDRVEIVPPSIDAFSPKNQSLEPATVDAIQVAAGIVGRPDGQEPGFVRQDGSPVVVRRRARMIEDHPVPPDAQVVVQVSRWDRLKDPVGVLEGFARHVPAHTGAHLVVAGPRTDGVSDDPESGRVFREVEAAWGALPADARGRVHLACLPVEDDDENAAVVNALQRRAAVVVQKSLAEGFGLTVAEAMWKERPVVASGVGGIRDQIVDGESGLLVDDPADLPAFGAAVTRLLDDPDEAARIGRAGRQRILENFLPHRHLRQWLDLLGSLRQPPVTKNGNYPLDGCSGGTGTGQSGP